MKSFCFVFGDFSTNSKFFEELKKLVSSRWASEKKKRKSQSPNSRAKTSDKGGARTKFSLQRRGKCLVGSSPR